MTPRDVVEVGLIVVGALLILVLADSALWGPRTANLEEVPALLRQRRGCGMGFVGLCLMPVAVWLGTGLLSGVGALAACVVGGVWAVVSVARLTSLIRGAR